MSFHQSKLKGLRPEPENSKPDYISGSENNPHGGVNKSLPEHYKDHGKGRQIEAESGEPKTLTKKIW